MISSRKVKSGILKGLVFPLTTTDRRQSKTLLTIDERGSKMLETVFSIVICYQLGDKWQSKTLFLTILSTFVDSINFSIAAYPGCSLLTHLMPLFYTDHESLDSPRIDNCKDSAVFVENCKFSNPFCDVLRFSYEAGKKQLRIFAGFGWIRPEPPRYCAEFTTMCNSIFQNYCYTLKNR